jgi:hypothetical protein
MSRIKPFGHPIALEHLDLFQDPDHIHLPSQWEGHTYYRTEWWTLRTTQATPYATAETCPVDLITLAAMDQAASDALPAKDWKAMDDIAPLLNKFPSRLWERTQFRHHLQSYPLVKIAHHTAQRGILQLCTRLPRAEVFTGLHLPLLTIRFRTGVIVLHKLPFHWHQEKISLSFYQPKHDPMKR